MTPYDAVPAEERKVHTGSFAVSGEGTLTNDIEAFMHCRRCIEELPRGESPESWARISFGGTADGGIQAWCVRHDLNIYRLIPIKEAYV